MKEGYIKVIAKYRKIDSNPFSVPEEDGSIVKIPATVKKNFDPKELENFAKGQTLGGYEFIGVFKYSSKDPSKLEKIIC
jgi:hypothetical protein